jgi:predicted double-glycine peptidase
VFTLEPIAFVAPVALPASGAGSDSGAAQLDRIPVRMRTQDPADVSCGVQSLGMALEALGGSAPTSDALLGFLLDNNYLYDFGTGVEELALAARSFGYAGSLAFHGWSLAQLQAELAAGRPVVVDLGANGPDEPGHFVTVTGISPDGSRVAYSDPILGERIATTAEFLALWNLQGDSGVAVATTPPAPPGADYEPWAAAALAMMATLALAPSMLNRRTRPGVGGAIEENGSGSGVTTYVGASPPFNAPEGYIWSAQPIYTTETRTVLEYEEIPKMVYRQVLVGTEIEQVPFKKRIEVDEGRWVTKYKTETYVSGYRTKKILLYYRSERYVKYYRQQRYWSPYGNYYKPVPVYGYRQVPVYGTDTTPIYSSRPVEDGKEWEANWVTHEITDFRAVEKPVYEMQWVQEGVQRVPVEREVSTQVLTGEYRYTLIPDPNYVPENEMEAATPEEPLLMLATGNMHVRASPSSDSEHLAYLGVGDRFSYTGETAITNGAEWLSVSCSWFGKPITGWVISGYSIPAPQTTVPDRTVEHYLANMGLVWDSLGTSLQQGYIDQARAAFNSFLAEIQHLTDSLVPRDLLDEEILRAVDVLTQPPGWYLNGGIPDSFYGRSVLTDEALEALQLLLIHGQGRVEEATAETWKLAAEIFCITKADLELQVFGNAVWPVEDSTSAGDFPVRMYVTRKYGSWLRAAPDPDAPNLSAAFTGVPQGERVTWTGEYHIGVDEDGNRCTYYKVEWDYNNHTYIGWIPSGYLSPKVVDYDPYSELVYGDWPVNTHGWGDGAAAWERFTTSGGAQYLNLYELFRSMGFPLSYYEQFSTRHKNLCGELAVMAALGISLEEGFARFAELGSNFIEILADPDRKTGADQLKNFINAFSNLGWSGQATTGSSVAVNSLLQEGKKVIALVTIDVNTNGMVSGDGGTNHWVEIREINTDTGEIIYYNPYTNEVSEPISLAEFEQAWENASGGTQTIVTASRA